MTGSQPRQVSSWSVVVLAALSLGAFDVLVSMLRRHQSYEDLLIVLPSAFSTALCAILVLVPGWLGAGRWRARGVDPLAVLAAWTAGLGTAFLAARIARFSVGDLSPDNLFFAGLFVIFGVVAGGAAYYATLGLATQPRARGRVLTLLGLCPALLFATMLFVWAQLYRFEELLSAPGIVVCVLYLAALLALGHSAWRGGPARAVRLSGLTAVAGVIVMLGLALQPRVMHWLKTAEHGHAVRHVVLLSSDTLRADALSVYGNTRVATPALESLARDGVVFEGQVSVAPWTLPALSTLLTGVAPAVHRVRLENGVLPEALDTLAERFAAAGYHTGALVDNAYLRPKARLAQGFEDYLYFQVPDYGHALGPQVAKHLLPSLFPPERPATIEEQTAAVERWLSMHADRDFFLWVHYFDPHAPYAPARSRVHGTPPPGMDYVYKPPPQLMNGMVARSAEQQAWIRGLYEAEVEGVDAQVGRVLGRLRALGLYDDAVIAFTSDHGEEFWEHGGQGHGHSLYDELLRVPLIVKFGHARAGTRVAARFSSERVAATLLEAADVEFDQAELSGAPLQRLFDGQEPPLPVVSESSIVVDDQRAVSVGAHKYMLSLVTGRERVFDLASDPGEQRPASGEELFTTGRRLLGEHEQAADALRSREAIVAVDGAEFGSATLQRLRGLGYLQ